MMASTRFPRGELARARVPMLLGVVAAVLLACGGDEDPADEAGTEPVEETDTEETDTEEPAAEEPDTEETDTEEPAADAGDWPEEDIRLIIPTDVGGGLDTAARTYQAHWEEELGVNLQIDHRPGANYAIGLEAAAAEGEDCGTIVTKAIPHLLYSYLTQDVNFTYDDFYPIAAVQVQPGVVVVSADSEYETFDDLLADIEARPGEVRASTSGLANNNYAGIVQMENLLGIDVNVVGYDGGGPARNAVLSGEVDFTHAALFATVPLAEDLNYLAIHQDENQWEDITGEIPTLSEATGEEFGNNSSTYGIFANRACYEDHPERYQVLVDTFEAVKASEDYRADLEELDALDALYEIEPDAYHEEILDAIEVTQQTIDSSDEL